MRRVLFSIIASLRQTAGAIFPFAGSLLCSLPVAADESRSGPQAGAGLPGPLQAVTVLHAEKRDAAGKKSDYVEEYGQNPVVLVVARTDSDHLRKLLQRINAEVARHKMDKKKAHALLVMLSDEDDIERTLKNVAEKHAIKHVTLSLDSAAGPSNWSIAEDADVTVVFYNRQKVEANHAFGKGELSEEAIGTVIADLPKIVGK